MLRPMPRIARYNADGTLDTTFGTSGVVDVTGFFPLGKLD